MKVIVKIDRKIAFEETNLAALGRATERLDRAGVDYTLEFVRAR